MKYYCYGNDSQIYFVLSSDMPRQSLFCHQALPSTNVDGRESFFKLKQKCWELTLLIYQNCFLAPLSFCWRTSYSLFQYNQQLFGTKSILSFKAHVNSRLDITRCWVSRKKVSPLLNLKRVKDAQHLTGGIQCFARSDLPALNSVSLTLHYLAPCELNYSWT